MQVYLDNSATTKLDERVFEKMKPYFSEEYGNASSIHFMGDKATEALDAAKENVAEILNCKPENIIFTSGASEANNLILKGIAHTNKEKGKRIIVSQIEHASISAPAKALEKEGFEIMYVPVDENGVVKIDELEKLINEKTILVSIMTVNNEIGSIQDIKKIAELAHENGALFHTDAVQAVPYLELDVQKSNVDFLSLSAHKFNGPKGIGLAYIKEGQKVTPLIDGGGQEYGIRGGTYNIPGIIGMAEALKLSYGEREKNIANIREVRDYLWKRMEEEIENIYVNGSLEKKTPNNLTVRFESIEGEAVLMDLSTKGICVSTGSACSAKDLRASSVLKAIGLKDEHLNSNIRFTVGKFNTKEEIDYVVSSLKETVERLRSFTSIKS